MCDSFSSHNIFICGDFNLPNINWDSSPSSSRAESRPQETVLKRLMDTVPKKPNTRQVDSGNQGRGLVNGDKTSESFLNCVIDNGLSQIVCCNTRNENILDLVLCNAFDNIPVADIVPPLVSSDHGCVKFDTELKCIKNSINTMIPTYTDINILTNYNYKKANFTILSNYLTSIDWIALFSQKNVNDMWLIFTQKLLEAVSKYVPVNNRNSRHKRIIPKALKKLINKKKMWKLARKTKNAFFIGQHADLSRKCKREINNNERFKINNLCKSKNMKNFYDFINKKIGRVKTSTIIKSNYTHERVDNIMLQLIYLPDFFTPLFQLMMANYIPRLFFCFRMNDNIIFDSNTINQLIDKLPNKCSNGPDGISIF